MRMQVATDNGLRPNVACSREVSWFSASRKKSFGGRAVESSGCWGSEQGTVGPGEFGLWGLIDTSRAPPFELALALGLGPLLNAAR